MNSQLTRSSFFFVGIVLSVMLFCPNTSESSPLASLVREYMQADSAESSQILLQAILNHPNANLQAIGEVIRDLPQYLNAPVGVQPERTVWVRGEEASFAFYVPPSYSPKQAYPLIVCLHGAGFTGASYLDRWIPRLQDRYILACPTMARGAWWTRFAENLVLEISNNVSKEYHIDSDRIFLTGMSNGGIGAWIIGMHHADLFAGIAPMASGLDDVMFPFVENLINTPVYVLHGAEDQVMPVQLSRDLVQEMKRHGVPYQYREHQLTHPHAGGHFFPRQELPALIDWFDQQRRPSLSQKISIVRDATHLSRLSWGRIDETEEIAAFSENLVDKRDRFIAEGIFAKLTAEVTGQNIIEVNTVRVRRYTLFLTEKLVDFSQPIIVKTNGVKSFEGIMQPDIETLLNEVRLRSDFHNLYPAELIIDVLSPE